MDRYIAPPSIQGPAHRGAIESLKIGLLMADYIFLTDCMTYR